MTTANLPPAIVAALNNPDVCGYLDESGGPCENCTGGVAHELASGTSEADVLADIEQFRLRGADLQVRIDNLSRKGPE